MKNNLEVGTNTNSFKTSNIGQLEVSVLIAEFSSYLPACQSTYMALRLSFCVIVYLHIQLIGLLECLHLSTWLPR